MPKTPTSPAHAAELKTIAEQPAQLPMMSELYRRAEVELRKKRKQASRQRSKANARKPEADPRRLLHELQVHQVELELQNAELQEARDRMEETLEQFSDLYDFAPIGYFTLAPDRAIQRVNLNGARLVGIDRGDLVGQSFERLVPPELRPVLRAVLQAAFAGPVRQTGDFELLGKKRPFRVVNIEAQRSAGGRECRVVMLDISERKRVEEQVRVSEVRYRRLFEAAHDGVLLLDPATRKITDANPFMTKLLGYPTDQLVGKELFEIGLLKDEGASQEMFRKLKRSHEVRYEDLPLESQGGRHQEVEVVANLYQEDGHAVIQCNIRDITERKLAEEALRRNEALFSTLIEEAPYGVYVIDAKFRLQQVNRVARPVFKNVEPLIGRDFAEVHRLLWTRKISDPVIARFRHTLKTGEPYQSPEFVARRRDIGVKQIFEWQIQRVTLPGGERGVVAFFNDITERKRAEQTRRRVAVLDASNRKLELEINRRRGVEKSLRKSEREQRRLLDQARRMQGELQLLSRQVLRVQEEERKRISRELHDVVAQTLTVINVRLGALKKAATARTRSIDRDIARTQQLVEKSVDVVHQFALELRPAMLDDLGLVPALHSYVKTFARRHHLRIHLKVFAGLDKLDTDKCTVLYRVAQEALGNVAKHAAATTVNLIIQKLPEGIRMTIRDNGRSFSVRKLTDSNGAKRLGLLGMRERLEMVGGQFEVRAFPGVGTTIVAEVPLTGRGAPAGGAGDGTPKLKYLI